MENNLISNFDVFIVFCCLLFPLIMFILACFVFTSKKRDEYILKELKIQKKEYKDTNTYMQGENGIVTLLEGNILTITINKKRKKIYDVGSIKDIKFYIPSIRFPIFADMKLYIKENEDYDEYNFGMASPRFCQNRKFSIFNYFLKKR